MFHHHATIRLAMAAGLCLLPALAPPVRAATIIDEWTTIRPPPAPALKEVTADPRTTALLVLDMVHRLCDAQRPRCQASVAPVRQLLDRAGGAHMAVVYTVPPGGTPADVVEALAPMKEEPVVSASADKFLGSDLEKILREKGIKTVIIVGTSASGAVLMTAGEAAIRGFEVIVPVDGISSPVPYAEQYTAWHLMNSPGPSGHVTLTRSDMIRFGG